MKGFNKLNIILLVICVAIITTSISLRTDTGSASIPFEYLKTIGPSLDRDVGNAVIELSDGGFVVLGHTESSGAGNNDIWLLRFDSEGELLFEKTYGGTNNEFGITITQTSDGGFAIGGMIASFGAGSFDGWIIRTDKDGNIIWQKAFGGGSFDQIRGIVENPDGGFTMVGTTQSFGLSGEIWTFRVDSAGTIIWQKKFGGTGFDLADDLIRTSDGGYVIGGSTGSFGVTALWLIKIDANGTRVFDKFYEDSTGIGGIAQTTDGGFVLTGQSNAFGDGSFDAHIIKTDANGDLQWQRAFGQSGVDTTAGIVATHDGGIVIIGTDNQSDPENTPWVMKLNSSGGILWKRNFIGSSGQFDFLTNLEQITGGGFVLTGVMNTTTNIGDQRGDAYLFRIDRDGNAAFCTNRLEEARPSPIEAPPVTGVANDPGTVIVATETVTSIVPGSPTTTQNAFCPDFSNAPLRTSKGESNAPIFSFAPAAPTHVSKDTTVVHQAPPLPEAPSYVCGDGKVEGQEDCDDGNTSDGDGCSSNCFTEHLMPEDNIVISNIKRSPFNNNLLITLNIEGLGYGYLKVYESSQLASGRRLDYLGYVNFLPYLPITIEVPIYPHDFSITLKFVAKSGKKEVTKVVIFPLDVD